ncbi:DUF1700 domain-containing protein [Anaerorhabdus sp.]|jgi:uncharacterized membrane protein|uniref:DUF1700 domain-containing protein n=1 Tax=Anaerorhabdus sp. TaxID=1872524 RepID=UPI002FC6E1FD
MNKKEFLNELKHKLDILTDSEVKDILDEYSDTIDQKIQEGKTEEEAVKDFGDIDELVAEIFDAYKIKGNKNANKHKDAASKVGDVLNDMIDSLSSFFSTVFKDLSVEGISRTLVLVGVGLVVLLLLKIPFAILEGLFRSIVYMIIPFGISHVFNGLISFIFTLVFLVLSIVIIISFIRVGVNGEEINSENLFKRPLSEGLDSLKSTKKKTSVNDDIKKEYKAEDKEFKKSEPEYSTFKESETKEAKSTEKHSTSHYFGKSLVNIFVWVLRFFGIILMIPMWMTIIGLGIGVGLVVYLLTQNVSIWGVFILLVGIMGIIIVIINLCMLLIFNKRVNGIVITVNLIVSAIFIGVGIPLTMHEISRFDIVYIDSEESADYLNNRLEEIGRIDYDSNAIYDLSYYENVKFVKDDTLNNEIVIETYDSFDYYLRTSEVDNDVRISVYRDHYGNDFDEFKDSIGFSINALKDGKVSGYDLRMIQIVVRYPVNEHGITYIDYHNNQRIEK